MSRAKLIYFTKILLFFIIYFATAKFGLSLQAVSHFATLVWIPSGMSLAVLLLFGKKYWPGISLGAFFVNLFTGAPPLVAVGIAIGNTLEGLIGFYLLRNFFDFINSLGRLRDVLSLVLITTPLATLVSATIGVASLVAGGAVNPSQFFPTWIAWWVGDAISIYIMTPVILLWAQNISLRNKPMRAIEFIILVITVIVIGTIIFNDFSWNASNMSMLYLVFPPIIWAALRFGQREVSAIILIFSSLAIWATMLGFGPFTSKDINISLLYLQFFMIITSLTSLILAVVVSERRELEERKDDFVSMASHELKTPVTSLKLYSELVKTKLKEEKLHSVKKYLDKLDDQIYKLTALVIDLLDVTRMQSGKLQIHKKSCDLNALIKETAEAMQRTTKNHSLSIKGKIAQNINVDKDRIYQVIVNLLSNAIKYSPDGGKIIIHCKNKKDYVQIGVEDYGIGIDKSQLRRIFEKMYRVPEEGEPNFHGLGIGLYVSSEIVKMHKGKIWAESNKSKGSIFYFTLPIQQQKKPEN